MPWWSLISVISPLAWLILCLPSSAALVNLPIWSKSMAVCMGPQCGNEGDRGGKAIRLQPMLAFAGTSI